MNEKSFKSIIAKFLKEESSEKENKYIEDFENYLLDSNQSNVFKDEDHKNRIKNEIYRVINKNIQTSGFPWYRIAAVIVILIGTAFLTLYFNSTFNNARLSFQTENSPEYVILPDSSTVWLDSHSKLSYHKNFTASRKIELHGEAFFNVKSNTNKPFTVDFDQHHVLVTGTKFTISNRNKKLQEVAVKEGSVRVSSNTGFDQVDLKANTYLEIRPGKIKKEIKAFSDKGYWSPKRLIFKNIPLHAVLDSITARYNLELVVPKETSLNLQKKITASYSGNTSIYELVDGLSLLTPYQYDINVKSQELKIRTR